VRQEGQRTLASRSEQPLGREDRLEPLEPGQQLTDTDRADVGGRELQGAAREVHLRLARQDHALPVGQARTQVGRAGDRKRDVGHRVPQRQESRTHPGTPRNLRDLALDPDPPEPPDPRGDEPGYGPHRQRLLRRGLGGHPENATLAPTGANAGKCPRPPSLA